MTLPTSGPLSLNDIQTEFGGSNPISLNEYYAGGSYVPAGTTGTYGAVPTSGQISIQNFYGTSAYYTLSRSLRFRSSASAYMSRTMSNPTSSQKMTFSFWWKRGTLNVDACIFGDFPSPYSYWAIGPGWTNGASDTLSVVYAYSNTGIYNLQTTQVFRDPTAWYHVVVAIDTQQATASDRIKIYVNGSQVTSFITANYPAQNTNILLWNASGQTNYIASQLPYYGGYMDMYLADVYFIDGQQLTPSSFGATNSISGTWQPVSYAGTYGTNGFHLTFTDNSSLTSGSNVGLGKDFSGNGNYWNTTNISLTAGVTYDSMTDVPTWTNATTANYAVWNPLKTSNVGYPSTTTQNGNLTTTSPTAYGTFATMAMSSGKWYWEYTITTGTTWTFVGVVDSSIKLEMDRGAVGGYATGYYGNGTKGVNGTFSAYGSSFTTNDIIGVALDCDANTVQFYKNNVAQGSISLPTSAGTLTTAFACDENNAGSVVNVNFGQRPLSYTPPTGFKAVNTYNLAAAAIIKANQYMDATLWTGNGTSGRAITNAAGFQPDLVWAKKRAVNTANHNLEDSVRGAGKALYSNTTDPEATNDATQGYISAFNSNGFSVAGTGMYTVNETNETYVGWQWKKGTTPGFDIVTYTGTGVARTVSHNLGVVPKMIITKGISGPAGQTHWTVYHAGLHGGVNPQQYYLRLNSGSGEAGLTAAWNDTAPTSSVFTVGTSAEVNYSGESMLAYVWAPVAGFSDFGFYTGNGSTDGPFVYLGFRPKYIFIKRADSSSGSAWFIYDSVRNTYNVVNKYLRAELSNAEATTDTLDFLANGIKLRVTDISYNASGGSYVYAAFAESPFKYANAY